ncbi:hypothetical protein GCM10008935_24810 [Alkalibacillus silvisoli]|uniref:Uncharacterized protein n=1 Tax=Alkalibacillus silvisoli TaxID=392823 RepID=A0ABN1A5D0_9BACI
MAEVDKNGVLSGYHIRGVHFKVVEPINWLLILLPNYVEFDKGAW